MIKIVVLTDIHANLPALRAVLNVVREEGYDLLIQTGDVIAIGPYPSECLDLLLSMPRVENVLGNHELYFVDGIPEIRPDYMSEGEYQHQLWTHSRLSQEHKSIIASWPFLMEHEFEGVKAVFLHSVLDESRRDFKGIHMNPNESDLNRLFEEYQADLVFYGHRHEESDVLGRARYINPGSLGCSPTSMTRFCVGRFHKGQFEVEHHRIAYDDRDLFKAFEDRQVPDRRFIYKTFFGDRFG